ncbi:MAG: bifunctional adenosylcobinamide kinase/adenosylcobinamide-phosphate guanylyltransferase [Candidatus Hydrogenedentes bacterium]|nr:bifunctional adenosylcobinamide kinase/adenosylcobinamide-phosphate guanylyltransferase [Candidatus Hydrogenedentota bacterium]
MAEVILVTGGARSGKSALALQLTDGYAPRVFIATAEAFDDEMRERIARHRAERGPGWDTIEAPLDLAGAIRRAGAPGAAVLVDCLTVWLGNRLHHEPALAEDGAFPAELDAAIRESQAARLVLVTNEVGMGIVPENELARRFRDLAGRLNQRVAALANRVILSVCGQALTIKDAPGKENAR